MNEGSTFADARAEPMTKKRLDSALVCYGVLAATAVAALDGPFRLVILIFLGGLAVKSWVAYKKEQL